MGRGAPAWIVVGGALLFARRHEHTCKCLFDTRWGSDAYTGAFPMCVCCVCVRSRTRRRHLRSVVEVKIRTPHSCAECETAG